MSPVLMICVGNGTGRMWLEQEYVPARPDSAQIVAMRHAAEQTFLEINPELGPSDISLVDCRLIPGGYPERTGDPRPYE